MADRGEADHIFKIALPERDECPVDHIDQRQQNDPGQVNLRPFRQELYAHTQRCICTEFHQDTRMDHRNSSRSRYVTVRTPVVEREQARQYRKADKDYWEPKLRNTYAAKSERRNIK